MCLPRKQKLSGINSGVEKTMEYRGWKQLKTNKKNGISMALVICVAAFFTAFSAAILYTTGLLTAQSTQRLKEERCYQLAKSFSEALAQELVKYEQKDDSNAANTIYAYANKFLDGEQYLEYDAKQPDVTSYRYVIDRADLENLNESNILPEGYGNITVTLAKEQNGDENINNLHGGEIAITNGEANYDTIINEIKNTTVRQYLMTLKVTAYYDDVTYTYSTEFVREEKYGIRFTHNGTTIVWDNNNWRRDNTGGEIYTPSGSPILYEYQKNNTTSCKFIENTYKEEGDAGKSE